MRLPDVDGIEILNSIKQHDATKNIPVCVLTVMEDPQYKKECLEIGCDAYIKKPISNEDLIEIINSLDFK